MKETRTVFDPFLQKNVEIDHSLTDRLRGKYASGPTMPNGQPEFGYRTFPTPPIQHDAADRIDQLNATISDLEERIENSHIAASETQRSPGTMFVKMMSALGFDFGESETVAETVDAQWKKFYAEQP